MLHNKLPKVIKPAKLCHHGASQGLTMRGCLEILNSSKLSDKILGEKVKAELKLEFSLDESDYCRVTILGQAQVEMQCQRCLCSLPLTIELDSVLSPVANDHLARQLPDNLEPLLAPEGEVNLEQWIKEEVLLSLPLVPKHDYACNPKMQNITDVELEPKSSPFAQLKVQLER